MVTGITIEGSETAIKKGVVHKFKNIAANNLITETIPNYQHGTDLVNGKQLVRIFYDNDALTGYLIESPTHYQAVAMLTAGESPTSPASAKAAGLLILKQSAAGKIELILQHNIPGAYNVTIESGAQCSSESATVFALNTIGSHAYLVDNSVSSDVISFLTSGNFFVQVNNDTIRGQILDTRTMIQAGNMAFQPIKCLKATEKVASTTAKIVPTTTTLAPCTISEPRSQDTTTAQDSAALSNGAIKQSSTSTRNIRGIARV